MVAPAVDEPDLKQTLVRQASWSSCTSLPPAVHFPTEAAIWLYERIVSVISTVIVKSQAVRVLSSSDDSGEDDDIASKTPIDDDKTNLEFVKRYKRYHLKVIRHNVKLMKLNSMLKHKLEMSNKEVETLSRFIGRLIRNASDQDLSLSEWIGRLKELKSLVEAKDEALRQVKERV
ncbi:hypothetical protein LWI28_012383 [Acer negundo]|uniref:Uncharacterized protein n=1 Tax=Acer negundo TaxID=4023 RepID=A0AAD5J409_ACENE|nr:hypothetical protein LWI28_012383 [Acer negundo]